MSDGKDNVVRVDFRRGRVLDDGATPEPLPEPDAAASEAEAEQIATESNAEESNADATKAEQFAGMLEHGLVLVTIDTRVRGVCVPERFAGTPQLHLSFSLRFRLDDFEYDDNSIRATLSFDDGPFYVIVPWDAVYGLSSEALDEQLVFQESFPPELLALLPSLADDPEELGYDDGDD